MQLTGFGGGIMLAIAAALWLTYLVPSWLKRREYLATELNAVRLQQTIRVMAETAEAPAAVRAELAARRAAAQVRVVQSRPAPSVATRPLPARPLPARPVPEFAQNRASNASNHPEFAQIRAGLAARRLRRTRALTSLVMLTAIAVLATQIWLMVTTGIGGGSWVVLATSSLVALTSIAALGRLAEIARTRRAAPAVARRTSLRPREAVVEAAGWTPVAVPKPLYLSRSAAPVEPAVDPEFELQLAAAAAERARRAEFERVATIDRHQTANQPVETAASADAGRFASMGVVDAAASGTTAPDLDAVLARRRAV